VVLSVAALIDAMHLARVMAPSASLAGLDWLGKDCAWTNWLSIYKITTQRHDCESAAGTAVDPAILRPEPALPWRVLFFQYSPRCT
jgi:hypothetical protein